MSTEAPDEQCSLCQQPVTGCLGDHLRQQHGEAAFRQAVLAAKANGMPDAAIGDYFGLSFRQLEQLITAACGTNISTLKPPKPIKAWQPAHFRQETTTVWSFKQRGNWATHDGRYRGNWSPYIPRNLILKYSRPGDTVLDYFVGGGTTAVEARLLGRRCIARDINPGAINLTLENLSFFPSPGELDHPIYAPVVSTGDARHLADIPTHSIDLICAHPPYAGIIHYSSAEENDLSQLNVADFLAEMGKVARESWRVLKPGGKCAILIGDARRARQVVPIGFQTIRVFLAAGFTLRELVIKRQHHCKATGFWYNRSLQHNFLLLAHEYLPIFQKPEPQPIAALPVSWETSLPHHVTAEQVAEAVTERLETTTVWIFPQDRLEAEIKRNLVGRLAMSGSGFVEVQFDPEKRGGDRIPTQKAALIYVHAPPLPVAEQSAMPDCTAVREIAQEAASRLSPGGFLVWEAKDRRVGEMCWPTGLLLYEEMTECQEFAIKEIVIVVPEDRSNSSHNDSSRNDSSHNEPFKIIHRYLLIYVRK